MVMPVMTPSNMPNRPGMGMEAAPVVAPTLVRKSTDSMPSRRVVVKANMNTEKRCFFSTACSNATPISLQSPVCTPF